MVKQINKIERIGFSKDKMISFLHVMQINTNNLLTLQKAFMDKQQELFHMKGKFRHVSRTLKLLARACGRTDLLMSEEELDQQIKRKEN